MLRWHAVPYVYLHLGYYSVLRICRGASFLIVYRWSNHVDCGETSNYVSYMIFKVSTCLTRRIIVLDMSQLVFLCYVVLNIRFSLRPSFLTAHVCSKPLPLNYRMCPPVRVIRILSSLLSTYLIIQRKRKLLFLYERGRELQLGNNDSTQSVYVPNKCLQQGMEY